MKGHAPAECAGVMLRCTMQAHAASEKEMRDAQEARKADTTFGSAASKHSKYWKHSKHSKHSKQWIAGYSTRPAEYSGGDAARRAGTPRRDARRRWAAPILHQRPLSQRAGAHP